MPRYPVDRDESRYCPLCDDWLPLTEFYPRPPDKLNRRCKAHHIDKSYEARLAGFKRDPSRRYEYNRRIDLMKKYKMTVEEYVSRLEAQNRLCAICGQPETVTRNGEPKLLTVDHCHQTGTIRELLCQKCNQGLGQFRDNPDFLRLAADYLEKWAS